jgi:hypothetical protein
VTRGVPVVVVLGWLLVSPPAGAALLTLTDAQQAEALRVGQKSVTTDAGFDAEWRVDNPGGESLTVMTPFYRLALAARNAAFKNEPVKPQDQSKMLQTMRDRLTFWVQLHGAREDFARYYAPRLQVGDLEVEPVFVQNERTGLRQANGAFLARSVYAFPTRDVTGTSKVVLLIRDPQGQLVSRFAVDLAKMR